MNFFEGIFLGVLQGVSEFLPVSSSGHLLIARNLLGLGDVPVLFDIILHMATLIVVVVMFRKKIIQLLKSLFLWLGRRADDQDRRNMKLIGIILLAVFITGVLGLFIESLELSSTPKIVFPLFIVTALILWTTRKSNSSKDYEGLSVKDGIVTGIAQGLGVLPGISRSGITISAGLFRKMNRDVAAEYSFLISIPAILGALLLDLKDATDLFSTVSLPVLAVSFAATMISGFLALTLLVRLVHSGKFYYFSFYLIPVGILGLIFF